MAFSVLPTHAVSLAVDELWRAASGVKSGIACDITSQAMRILGREAMRPAPTGSW